MLFPQPLVDLREVKEVRLGKSSKDFDRWAEDARRFDTTRCYVVYYGSEFCLKTLSIAGIFLLIHTIHIMKIQSLVLICS